MNISSIFNTCKPLVPIANLFIASYPSTARLYSTCVNCVMSTPSITNLIIDFDETITREDTIAHIPSLAAFYSLPAHSIPHPPRIPFDHPLLIQSQQSWKGIVQAYLDDLSKLKPHTHPLPTSAISKETSEESLRKQIESASLDRVEKCGALKGLSRTQLFEFGKTGVETRDGWEAFAVQLSRSSSKFEVVIASLNWSQDLVRGVLSRSLLENVELIINDLEFDSTTGLSTGSFRKERRVLTGEDKVRYLEERKGSWQRTIYVGDSTSDLPCLVSADLGILLLPESSEGRVPNSVLRKLERYSPRVEVVDVIVVLEERRAKVGEIETVEWWTANDSATKRIVVAKNWKEVSRLVFGEVDGKLE
ncbi:hypothetical protein HDV05_004249 [Chytridiales sp. JEL 0842]|nr:hypothetical protein HDV05_004249 [Chytridiales sp. JEL 0842]